MYVTGCSTRERCARRGPCARSRPCRGRPAGPGSRAPSARDRRSSRAEAARARRWRRTRAESRRARARACRSAPARPSSRASRRLASDSAPCRSPRRRAADRRGCRPAISARRSRRRCTRSSDRAPIAATRAAARLAEQLRLGLAQVVCPNASSALVADRGEPRRELLLELARPLRRRRDPSARGWMPVGLRLARAERRQHVVPRARLPRVEHVARDVGGRRRIAGARVGQPQRRAGRLVEVVAHDVARASARAGYVSGQSTMPDAIAVVAEDVPERPRAQRRATSAAPRG